MTEAEIQYNAFLESGELLEMHSDFTGCWAKDKVKFTRLYENNQKLINNIYVKR